MRKRATIKVSGRVQGVFYRYSTMQRAVELSLTGWVRNLHDGNVEILCEGLETSIESLILWCREGPPGARVDKVDITWGNATGEFKNFTISY